MGKMELELEDQGGVDVFRESGIVERSGRGREEAGGGGGEEWGALWEGEEVEESGGQAIKRQTGAFCLFLMTGMTSWLLVNSVYIEMPIFIGQLPEAEALASQISLMIQFSNVFPLVFVILHTRFQFQSTRLPMGLLIVFAIASSLFLSFTWDITVQLPFAEGRRSLCLYAGSFAAGIVGCMSVVLYYPFAAHYSPYLLSAVSLGMGLTGLVAAGLGVVQDLLGISVMAFFLLNAFLLAFGLAAYLLICSGKVNIPRDTQEGELVDDKDQRVVELDDETKSEMDAEWEAALEEERRRRREQTDAQAVATRCAASLAGFVNLNGWFLITSQVFNCFALYLLMGAIPYAVSAYEDADSLLSWMYMGAMVSGSLGRFMCTFGAFRTSSYAFLIACTLVQYAMAGVIGGQCLFGYVPWIAEDWIWVVVVLYIVLNFVNGYEDTLLYQVAVVTQRGQRNVQRVTLFIGLGNQVGAFSGSLVTFALVAAGVLHV